MWTQKKLLSHANTVFKFQKLPLIFKSKSAEISCWCQYSGRTSTQITWHIAVQLHTGKSTPTLVTLSLQRKGGIHCTYAQVPQASKELLKLMLMYLAIPLSAIVDASSCPPPPPSMWLAWYWLFNMSKYSKMASGLVIRTSSNTPHRLVPYTLDEQIQYFNGLAHHFQQMKKRQFHMSVCLPSVWLECTVNRALSFWSAAVHRKGNGTLPLKS